MYTSDVSAADVWTCCLEARYTQRTHAHKQPNSHCNLGRVDPFLLLPFLTWARHQSVCRGGNRGLHYLNPTHLYFIVGRHKRAVCWHMKGWISTWIIFRLNHSRHCMCNVMLMPLYPLCRGSLGGKDMARLNELVAMIRHKRQKVGKSVSWERWLMTWEIWIWKFWFWFSYAAME